MNDKQEVISSRKNKILVCVDLSYWLHYTVFGSVAEFMKKHPDEAAIWIKDPEEVDQKNLPDLLNCETFKRILKRFVMRRLETIDWQLKGHFQDQIDIAEGVDFIFAMDDYLKNNFRKEIYPEYKAHRKLTKRSYNNYKIHDYVLNVLFKELDAEGNYGYHIVKVPGAEGDDVIATLFREFKGQYMLNVLFASDRDFVQLEGVHQLNLFGKEVECKLGDEAVTPKEFLLAKVLMGDGADNISQVFERVGAKKALKLVRDKAALKQRLKEDADAVARFKLNEKLISFDFIPKDLTEKIVEAINVELYKNEVINKDVDFRDFMTL